MSTTKQTATELSDDLGEYAIETEDGGVRATVTDISSPAPDSDELRMTAELPDGVEVTETFAKPRVWEDTNKFVRIVQAQGYDASSLHFLEGEKLPVQQNHEDDWEFRDPRAVVETGAFAVAKIQAAGLVGWFVFAVMAYLYLSALLRYTLPLVSIAASVYILTARA